MESTLQESLDTVLEDLLGLSRSDLFPEESREPFTSADVSRQIAAVRRLEDQIDQYENQAKDARMFYDQRKAKCDERIAFLKRSILNYLDLQGLKNIQTPNGTAFKREATIRSWPDDGSLVSWAEEHLPEAVRVKREPDKRRIGNHIKATGEIPDGYSETAETRVSIR